MDEILSRTKKCQDAVDKMEEELLSLKKQELDKQEKLKRAECHLKKVLLKLGKRDMSKYEVSISSMKIVIEKKS